MEQQEPASTDQDDEKEQTQGDETALNPTTDEHFKKLLLAKNMDRFKVTDITDVTYEFLDSLQYIMKTTTHEILQGKIRSTPYMEDVMQKSPEGPLSALSKYSWSYFIKSKKSYYQEPIDTLGCLLINLCSEKKQKDPKHFAYVHIPNMVFDLQREIEIAYFVDDPENEFILNRSDQNERTRITFSLKSDDQQLNIDYLKDTSFFARKAGEFGFMWADAVKNDKYALPSPWEVIQGITKFNEVLIDE